MRPRFSFDHGVWSCGDDTYMDRLCQVRGEASVLSFFRRLKLPACGNHPQRERAAPSFGRLRTGSESGGEPRANRKTTVPLSVEEGRRLSGGGGAEQEMCKL